MTTPEGQATTADAAPTIESLAEAIRQRDAALQRAADLATAWEARAASDRRYADSGEVPEDVRDSITDGADEMAWYASRVRHAIALTD